MNTRLLAAQVIDKVTDGHSLSECLEPALSTVRDARDRALVQAICYGVCRYYTRLDVLLSHLLTKPMKAKDSDVHALLLVGLYQLLEMRIPEHAAVSETVNATEKLKKPWARGLVNAVLREFLRQREHLNDVIVDDEEAHYAHPLWWITAIKKSWPDHWQQILAANNEHPPFSLRVNLQHLTREEYISRCEGGASIIPETNSGIILASPMLVDELPGFAAGDVSVQDGAAQLAAELLDVKPGQRVLDACAAPGGKLTHLLEIEPRLSALVAVESDAKRMAAVDENLSRLHSDSECDVTCLVADAANTDAWWDGQLFDRILLDAPCSASGVIRRHPDIKLLRQSTDIKALAKEQMRLLKALWPLLKSGGVLLYATCSVFPEENTQVMEAFLASHPEAKADTIAGNWGLPCVVGRQILPGMQGMDGFYYATVRK